MIATGILQSGSSPTNSDSDFVVENHGIVEVLQSEGFACGLGGAA